MFQGLEISSSEESLWCHVNCNLVSIGPDITLTSRKLDLIKMTFLPLIEPSIGKLEKV